MRRCWGLVWTLHLSVPWQREFTMIMEPCQWIDFVRLQCNLMHISPYIWLNTTGLGTVFWVFNKCWAFRPLVTLSSWWHCWGAMRAWVNNSLLNHLICHFKASLLLFWLVCLYWIKGILCDYTTRSGRHREGSQWPLTSSRCLPDHRMV